MKYIVITTIQPPTKCLLDMAAVAHKWKIGTLAVGDRKTPEVKWPEVVEYLPISQQSAAPFGLATLIPENHYARKNIGYLRVISRGAEAIFDTDDDNAPLASWAPRNQRCEAINAMGRGWFNVYRFFSSELIWPRGLPLERVRDPLPCIPSTLDFVDGPIQQGLVNGSPDVDAVWRLLLDDEIVFEQRPSISLAPGSWCPFNSQSTWWFPEAYPLLYLPSLVSFRMTDIWRSFVAQRCLWELGKSVVFHAPDMVQERNPHNLLNDFKQEVPGYLENERIRQVLEGVALSSRPNSVTDNLHRCYEALIVAGLIPAAEMPILESWISGITAEG